MEKYDAINYLEKLEKGNFLTLNIPIMGNEVAAVTAMYVGKDNKGRYTFMDAGNFKLSKDFLERGTVTIDKEYDGEIAIDIHAKFKRELEKKRNKNRSIR